MGFFSRLFKTNSNKTIMKVTEPEEYKGYFIFQESILEGGQYRVAGRIEKQLDGTIKSHHFIRSDLLATKQDANDLMLKKSKMFIDQMGDSIFS